MNIRLRTALVALAAVTAAPLAAWAAPVPPSVASMIDAAAASGDPAVLKAVVDTAKKTNPGSAAEIDAQVAALQAKAEKARVEKLAHETLFQGIKGEGQVGVTVTSGNNQNTSVALGLNLSKETLHWKNSIALAADYQHSNGVTSDERFFAGYEGNYKFSPRFYALGTLSWERDTFSGYSNRYSGSLGLGYKFIDTPKVALSLEAGPAVRSTQYVATPVMPTYTQTNGAGRVAGAFSWTFAPNTVFTEAVSSFITSGDDTVTSNTAITTKLVGALSARISFLVQYDSEPPVGILNTDTTTRLTLVYGF